MRGSPSSQGKCLYRRTVLYTSCYCDTTSLHAASHPFPFKPHWHPLVMPHGNNIDTALNAVVKKAVKRLHIPVFLLNSYHTSLMTYSLCVILYSVPLQLYSYKTFVCIVLLVYCTTSVMRCRLTTTGNLACAMFKEPTCSSFSLLVS